MKTKNIIYTIYLLFMLTICSSSLAATTTSQITFPDDVDDEAPGAPIDGFVILGMAAGAYLGLRHQKKNKI